MKTIPCSTALALITMLTITRLAAGQQEAGKTDPPADPQTSSQQEPRDIHVVDDRYFDEHCYVSEQYNRALAAADALVWRPSINSNSLILHPVKAVVGSEQNSIVRTTPPFETLSRAWSRRHLQSLRSKGVFGAEYRSVTLCRVNSASLVELELGSQQRHYGHGNIDLFSIDPKTKPNTDIGGGARIISWDATYTGMFPFPCVFAGDPENLASTRAMARRFDFRFKQSTGNESHTVDAVYYLFDEPGRGFRDIFWPFSETKRLGRGMAFTWYKIPLPKGFRTTANREVPSHDSRERRRWLAKHELSALVETRLEDARHKKGLLTNMLFYVHLVTAMTDAERSRPEPPPTYFMFYKGQGLDRSRLESWTLYQLDR